MTRRLPWLALLVLASTAAAQTPAKPTPAVPTPPPVTVPTPRPVLVEGYIVTTEIKALTPDLKTGAKAPGEAEALASRLRQQAQLTSKFYLTQDLSRQEILSTDFILPAGTLILHKAGDRFYAIADPKAQTYLVMDAEGLLTALEGGAGIVNTQYQAKAELTAERKTIAGLPCKKSIVTVSYASTIPFENSTVLVQQKNDIEVWHTSSLVSSAALDHFFFKFQRDKTGTVQKVLAAEIGFPMEVNMVVTQGSGTGKKAASAQPGSLHFLVTDVKVDKKLDGELFRIPPAGYTRIEKNPYFKDGSLSSGAAKAAEPAKKP
jgi:hypothetical protein